MVLVSVTRLRVRSAWYLASFFWRNMKIMRQVQRTSGFLGGRLLVDAKKVFWTLTTWEDGAAVNVFRTQGAHGGVMPKLLDWCDEAALVHWSQMTDVLPSWQEAHYRMMKEGGRRKSGTPLPLRWRTKFRRRARGASGGFCVRYVKVRSQKDQAEPRNRAPRCNRGLRLIRFVRMRDLSERRRPSSPAASTLPSNQLRAFHP